MSIDWLEAQTCYPKVYWEGRNSDIVYAGAGAAKSWDHIPSIKERVFGGISFCDKTWDYFPKCYFFLPKHLRQQKKQTITTPSLLPVSLQREDSLSLDKWNLDIRDFLCLIENQKLQKIVFGRKTTLTFEQPISPFALLKQLKQQANNATLFAFQMTPETAFIGITPEKLYERKNRLISSDVVAATQPKGHTFEEDFTVKNTLFTDSKMKREFHNVKEFIKECLSPLCLSLQEGDDRIISTHTLHHLFNRISGELKSDVTDAQIISSLHPTSALGGMPRNVALELLQERESFTRGWYGAPIGHLTRDEADMCVGIRSALIEGNKIHLFAAAGIVQGSNPQTEWEELEHKMGSFLRLFHEPAFC